MIKICNFCGKEVNRVDNHHLIPRWFENNGGEVINVCRGCHTKLENRFDNFIKWGSFESPLQEQSELKKQLDSEYYYKNHERCSIQYREYYIKNRDKIIKYVSNYNKSHKERRNELKKLRYKGIYQYQYSRDKHRLKAPHLLKETLEKE
jgi:uncharacterized protein YlaI